MLNWVLPIAAMASPVAWLMLRGLAQVGGTVRGAAKMGQHWPRVEKQIQAIRNVLRQHFQISTDPVPFVGGTGYQTRSRSAVVVRSPPRKDEFSSPIRQNLCSFICPIFRGLGEFSSKNLFSRRMLPLGR